MHKDTNKYDRILTRFVQALFVALTQVLGQEEVPIV